MSTTTDSQDRMARVREMFAAVDTMDPDAMDEFLAPDATFVLGSTSALEGREAIHADTGEFYRSMAGLHHTVESLIEDNGKVVVR